MKLLKLEILNLASLDRQEGEVIDFESGALKECTIFSIVGPTGSGKSTILDAICLALYNRTPRYTKQKGDRKQNIEIYGEADDQEKNRLAPKDPRNILTHGKKRGYSKLTFLANNGTVYRAEWHVEFKTKKHGEAVTSLYTIDPVTGNETVAEWSALPQIIGLEYDQFLRTVLIAQGSFANFLNSNEQERYELLEKLIGNEDLYLSIVEKIKDKKDEAVNNYNVLSASTKACQKDMIEDKDELDELKNRIDVLEKESQEDKKELETIIETLGWYAADQKHADNIVAFRSELEEAMSLIEKHADSAQRLKLHDVTQPAVNIYNACVVCESNIGKQNETLGQLKESNVENTERLEAAAASLDLLKKAHAQALQTLKEQKPHITQAIKIKAELDVIIRSLKEKQAAATDAQTAFDNARKAVDENTKEIELKQKEVEKQKEGLAALTKSVDEKSAALQEDLLTADNAFQAEKLKIKDIDPDTLQAQKRRLDSMLGDINDGIRICTQIQEKSDILKTDVEQSEKLKERNTQIDLELGKLTIDQLTKEIETLNRTYTLMTSENWREHRRLLKDNKPCPLCGATEHPYSEDKDLQPLVNEMSGLIAQKQEALTQQNNCSKALSSEKSQNEGKLQHLSGSIPSLKAELEKLESEWQALSEAHPEWEMDLQQLEECRSRAEQACVAADKAVDDYNKTAKMVSELGKTKENFQKTLDQFKEYAVNAIRTAQNKVTEANLALNTETGKRDALNDQMKNSDEAVKNAQAALKQSQETKIHKEKALKDEIGDNDPGQYEKSLEDAVSIAADTVKNKEGETAAIREQIENTNGMIKAVQNGLSQEKTTFERKTQELMEWLRAYNADRQDGILELDDIIMMHGATDNWESVRGMLKKMEEDLTSKKTTLENEVKLQLKHQENKPEKSLEELTIQKAALESKSYDNLVNSKARLQNHENAVKMMGKMADQLQEALQAKTDWEQITDAIGTDGKTLRKIAQCYTLRFLVEHANDEIRKFNNRYELMQVKNSLGIRIIDHDRADDIRDTTSLSGGETFIVSLGLALGLSSLSSRSVSFENLFIDEGFGTLDPETLDTVIDSLAVLQSSQGKKVGVISHTNSMSDRITTRIRVVKKGNSGSSYIEIEP